MSKIIKIEQLTEAEARWEKYRSEKLLQRQTDAGQSGDPISIIDEARAEAERIRREAFESGFTEGREKGFGEATSEVQTALAFLKKLAASLKEEEQRLLKQVEPEIIKLAVAVAEKIVGDGIAEYVSLCRPLIREPGLVRRWQSGNHAKSTCISCNQCLERPRAGEGVVRCLAEEKSGKGN